jgi:ABC-type hemin transport system ATPase subunit
MVMGIESFKDKFKDYTDYYTIIGGTACDILLSESDLPFRATKDIDMILIMENGQIAAVGTHEELLTTSQIYREVYESQQKGVAQ